MRPEPSSNAMRKAAGSPWWWIAFPARAGILPALLVPWPAGWLLWKLSRAPNRPGWAYSSLSLTAGMVAFLATPDPLLPEGLVLILVEELRPMLWAGLAVVTGMLGLIVVVPHGESLLELTLQRHPRSAGSLWAMFAFPFGASALGWAAATYLEHWSALYAPANALALGLVAHGLVALAQLPSQVLRLMAISLAAATERDPE